jgi:hypothetical protein
MTKQADTQAEILALYANGPALLEAALNGLSESDLNLALTNDAWSIRQIVHHLVDGDDLWKICVKAALGNSDGSFTLQWYWDKSQLEWSKSWHYASRSLESSLALLRANRQQIMELIQQTPKAWERSIWLKPPNRPKERISIGWVLEMQARHIVEHIKDIQAIRQAHNV